MVGILDALGVRTAELVTHDIGIMVGFALAATHPERVSRWVAIDAPLPGVGPWDQITQDPAMWHFGFGGQDMERLVAGRERIYLDRFWNELSRDQKRFDEAKRQHYAALYAQPGAMRTSFAQFLAFWGTPHCRISGSRLIGLFWFPGFEPSRIFFVDADELDQVFDSEVV